jgi:hypothetical protein
MNQQEAEAFIDSPVEYSRHWLWWAFLNVFGSNANSIGDARLERITDEDRIQTERSIRSTYRIAGTNQEIFWAWEHGAWRITDASFESVLAKAPAAVDQGGPGSRTSPETVIVGPAPKPEPAPAPVPAWTEKERKVGLTFKIALGTAGAVGERFDSPLRTVQATTFAVGLDFPVTKYFWLGTGAAYAKHGVQYDAEIANMPVTIDEQVDYLQLPVTARLEVPFAGPSATFRLFARAGVGVDVAVKKDGSATLQNGTAPLVGNGVNWFDQQRNVNADVLFGGGAELGFGAAPSLYFGLDLTSERHLLNEWNDNFWADGANYRYSALQLGLYLKYQSVE